MNIKSLLTSIAKNPNLRQLTYFRCVNYSGWEWHPFAAEKKLVDHYAAIGRISRLASRQPELSRQGA